MSVHRTTVTGRKGLTWMFREIKEQRPRPSALIGSSTGRAEKEAGAQEEEGLNEEEEEEGKESSGEEDHSRQPPHHCRDNDDDQPPESRGSKGSGDSRKDGESGGREEGFPPDSLDAQRRGGDLSSRVASGEEFVYTDWNKPRCILVTW
uniref:Uncharacterized protein n=1 Tax=Chromera velia CCMP2878 TaxID=1169474 RepID=A0A0G4F0H1_9ALVE|eukprot:Cvel_14473.t1-p1 / transcript=Cvel_14473.t1 / gene=Cvel_14473 / organism=Chromera_velia_CCMP2878 / gene_product=hypothetical protein / transcript_product=hypothetical protein / location=Cvel_scaffold1031:10323-10766(+) / protein_length=148 / sequence_SO=supercontig / SO=protein_coding / is_pseudo=false